ncbi:DNA primase, partial [Acinetobacter baumannii]|nr:DNA primase [Acinetobacter baumannii]
KPQINIQKTTAALDPAIFTSWLIHLMENQKEKDVDLSMAKDIVQAVSSNEQKQVLPMLKVICQKNGWHDLDQALNLMSDKVEIRNNNEKEALNRVNMTLQTIFYASNNTTIDASKKEKAEEMLKNTIEFIGYLPISRAEKVNIYTNIKDNIFEATDEAEPRWSKTLLKLCKETISEMENKQVNQFENQKSLSYERT